jgi:hypothetical protein
MTVDEGPGLGTNGQFDQGGPGPLDNRSSYPSRAGNNTINHDDKQVDVSIDRMKEAGTGKAFLYAG